MTKEKKNVIIKALAKEAKKGSEPAKEILEKSTKSPNPRVAQQAKDALKDIK
jgi:hypothetical protein